MPCRRCTGRYRGPCGPGFIPAERRTRSQSDILRTVCTCRPGSRRRCFVSTTVTWEPGGWSTVGGRGIWEEIEKIDDGELWETPLSLKSRLLAFLRRRAVEQAERRGEPQET